MIISPPPTLPHVVDFCRSIAQADPVVVPCQPLLGEPLNECFTVVPEHVWAQGGEQLIGWAIWELPGVFIEGEFHAVWKNTAGELVDIVPRIYPFKTITFLPDASREYRGRQVDNIRQALVDDVDVKRFLYLARRKFQILNEGDLANQHDLSAVDIPRRVLRRYNDLCDEMLKLQTRFMKRF